VKRIHFFLVILLLCLCVSFFSAGSNSDREAINARIVSPFELEPVTINLQGNDSDGSPVTYTMELQPGAGYIDGTFPVTVGSETLTIPEQPIHFAPIFPGMINGPGGPYAVRGINGPNTSGNALNLTATLPETTVNLHKPISLESGTFSVMISPELNIDMPPISFSITEIEPHPSPIPLPYPNIALISNLHVKEMKISVEDLNIPEYHGRLQYSLDANNTGSAVPWSWAVSGVWDVNIRCYTPSTCIAQLKHMRTANLSGGALLNASEPGIPLLTGFSTEKLDENSEPHPNFRIQFTRQKPDSGHTLTFRDPLMNKINTQPFSNVAYIALGQWMRRMGDPNLKVKASYTGNFPVTWTISISPEQKMTLSWIME